MPVGNKAVRAEPPFSFAFQKMINKFVHDEEYIETKHIVFKKKAELRVKSTQVFRMI